MIKGFHVKHICAVSICRLMPLLCSLLHSVFPSSCAKPLKHQALQQNLKLLEEDERERKATRATIAKEEAAMERVLAEESQVNVHIGFSP